MTGLRSFAFVLCVLLTAPLQPALAHANQKADAPRFVLGLTPAEAVETQFTDYASLSNKITSRSHRIDQLSNLVGGGLYIGGIVGELYILFKANRYLYFHHTDRQSLDGISFKLQLIGVTMLTWVAASKAMDIVDSIRKKTFSKISKWLTRSHIEKLEAILNRAMVHADLTCGVFGLTTAHRNSQLLLISAQLTPEQFRKGQVYLDGKALSEEDFYRLNVEKSQFPIIQDLKCGGEGIRPVRIEKLLASGQP